MKKIIKGKIKKIIDENRTGGIIEIKCLDQILALFEEEKKKWLVEEFGHWDWNHKIT